MNFIETLKILIPVLVALFSGGFIANIYGRKKVDAEAGKLKADVVVTFADGWQKLAEKLEKRVTIMEEKYEQSEKRIRELEMDVEVKSDAIRRKDERINKLEVRINELEVELGKYREMTSKTEVARETLHQNVDESINSIKGPA